jgi:alkane 1-monooxygenase
MPLRAVVPTLIVFVAAVANLAGSVSPASVEFFALVGVCGFAAGIFAAPTAHELMHRQTRLDQHAATTIMLILGYPHFCIEHRYGHHRNVGTRADGATARLGENLYGYLVRAVPAGIVNTWTLETRRLRRSSRHPFSHHNRIVRWIGLLLLLQGAVYLVLGWAGVFFFICHAAVAVFTLETINYVQHYGLVRAVDERGIPEPVGPRHAWDSTHPVTNFVLLNLARHSDHHLHPHKHFAALKASGVAPRLPVGYFAVFWLAVCPLAWHTVMDDRALAARQESSPSLRSTQIRSDAMKTCPMCRADDLHDEARKCPHCGSWLSGWRRAVATTSTITIVAITAIPFLALGACIFAVGC